MVSSSAKAALIAFIAIVFAVGFLLGYYVYGSPATVTITVPETIVVTSPVTETVVETAAVTETVAKTVTRIETITATVEEQEYVLVDALGRLHRFQEPFSRVVSLAPSITEMVCLLGCCGKLVGVDKFSNYPPEVVEMVREGRLIVVGGYWTPSVERIIEANPDLVLASSGVPAHRQIAGQLEDMGIVVFFLTSDRARSVDDIVRDIRSISVLLGCGDAEKLVSWINGLIENVTAVLSRANATQPTVLVLFGTPEWGIYAAGGGTFIDYVVGLAGGVNAAGEYSGWPMLSLEDVYAMDPDYIVVTAMAPNVTGVYEAWRSVLGGLRAVEEGRLCVLIGPANDVIVRPGPRIGIAVQLLASILHPDLVEPPAGYEDYIYCGG